MGHQYRMGHEIIEVCDEISAAWKEGFPPTWDDMLRLARVDSSVRMMTTLVQRGDFTEHEALLRLIVGLVKIKQDQTERMVELVNRNPNAPIIFAADGIR